MPVRQGTAQWQGSVSEGSGTVKVGSGFLDAPYSLKARVEDVDKTTNPEELLGAAHAACFAMFLSGQIGRAGHTANRIHATSNVSVTRGESGLVIDKIHLVVEAEVPGMDAATFQELAEKSKTGCPVSAALASVPSITMEARLV